MKTLQEVLAYNNPYIVQQFRKNYAFYEMTEEEANVLFDDLKRYLWLTHTTNQKKSAHPEEKYPDISITDSMAAIDDIWHEFILVTEHYFTFCEEFFGTYIHHPPPMPRWAENEKVMDEQACYEEFLSGLLSEVYDYLGAEVALRWFDTYRKYLPENYAEKIGHHF